MLACLDVDYRADGSARAAALVTRGWMDAEPVEARTRSIPHVPAYTPGAFFRRELPCLLAVLAPPIPGLQAVIVDGYVTLDAAGTPGLGAHLFGALGGAVAVVGVAKSPYWGSPHAAPVQRGQARRPLYVTAAGLPLAEAAALVASMHGAHRLPTLLRQVDRLCRDAP